jgi:Uma2 family endonuclease
MRRGVTREGRLRFHRRPPKPRVSRRTNWNNRNKPMSALSTSTRLRIGRKSNGMLMTPEEFDAITDYDDRYRYELINGVLVVSPIAAEAEADPNEELGFLLRLHKQLHKKGAALDLTLPERYIATPNSRRRADRVLWVGLGRVPDPAIDVPTIAVEFVSRRKRDRERDYEHKRKEYLAAGVVEYWIIDRFRRVMTVYRKPMRKPTGQVVNENETYRTDLLPGFELPLAQILAVADKWKKAKKR